MKRFFISFLIFYSFFQASAADVFSSHIALEKLRIIHIDTYNYSQEYNTKISQAFNLLLSGLKQELPKYYDQKKISYYKMYDIIDNIEIFVEKINNFKRTNYLQEKKSGWYNQDRYVKNLRDIRVTYTQLKQTIQGEQRSQYRK